MNEYNNNFLLLDVQGDGGARNDGNCTLCKV